MEVQEKIKEIRLQKGISQKVLADALHVDIAVISNIEKGKREVKFSEVEKISKTFGMSLIDFVAYPKKYVEVSDGEKEPLEALLQIKLTKDKKEQVLKLVLGDKMVEILSK
jgi:transcriptional regulator with XRE-family HTH domain